MAKPKKNNEKTLAKKNVKTTSVKKSITKQKAPMKVPTVTKINIKKPNIKTPASPLLKTTKLADTSTGKSNVIKKIELLDMANEVAAAQLIKPATVKTMPLTKENVKPKTNKRRGRSSKKDEEIPDKEPVTKKRKADSTITPKPKIKKTPSKPKTKPANAKSTNKKESKNNCDFRKEKESLSILKQPNTVSKKKSAAVVNKKLLLKTSPIKKSKSLEASGSSTASLVTVSTKEMQLEEKIPVVKITALKESPVTWRSPRKEEGNDDILSTSGSSSTSTDGTSDTDSSSYKIGSKSSLHLSTSSDQREVHKDKAYPDKLDTVTYLLSKIDTRIEFPFYEEYINRSIPSKRIKNDKDFFKMFPEQRELIDAVNKALSIATYDEAEGEDIECENRKEDLEKSCPKKSLENPQDPWSYKNNFTCNEDDDDALSLYAESITGIESLKLDGRTSSPKKVEAIKATAALGDKSTRQHIHIAMENLEKFPLKDTSNIKDIDIDLYEQKPSVENHNNIGNNNPNMSKVELFEDYENYIDNFDSEIDNSKSLSSSSQKDFSKFYDSPIWYENELFNLNAGKNQTDINDNMVCNVKKLNNSQSSEIIIQKTIVCEKKQADSTAVKDKSYEEQGVMENTSSNPYKSVNNDSAFKTPPVKKVQFQTPLNKPYKTVIFRNLCFNFLLSECINTHCPFPHLDLRPVHVKRKLQVLSDDAFFEEYLLFRTKASFRRKYGICFVEECQSRKLVRILVQMSIDFTNSALNGLDKDRKLMRQAVESILLYFNIADLFLCSDLLRTAIEREYYICDHYIKIIAESQNFSQFKQVFVKLVDFIVGMDRDFRLDVAAQLLERVSVLRCDDQVCMAMIKIVENTDRDIFNNSNINDFEQQLSRNKNLEREYSAVKMKRFNSIHASFAKTLSLASPSESPESSSFGSGRKRVYKRLDVDREKKYTSPDTTKMDYMAPMPRKGPIIKRTLKMPIFNYKRNHDSVHWEPNNYKSNQTTPKKIYDRLFPPRGHYSTRQKWHGHRQVAFGERPSFGNQYKNWN